MFVNYFFFKKKEHGGAEAVGGLRASWAWQQSPEGHRRPCTLHTSTTRQLQADVYLWWWFFGKIAPKRTKKNLGVYKTFTLNNSTNLNYFPRVRFDKNAMYQYFPHYWVTKGRIIYKLISSKLISQIWAIWLANSKISYDISKSDALIWEISFGKLVLTKSICRSLSAAKNVLIS